MTIREGDLVRDRALALRFIDGLQAYEHTVEPNRRLDAGVAADHLAKMMRDGAARPSKVFVAESEDGTALGWVVVLESQDETYVVAEERRFALIAELYLVEAARGTGLGRALIGACEDWAKACGIAVPQIGVLGKNARAREVYAAAGFDPYAMQLRKYL